MLRIGVARETRIVGIPRRATLSRQDGVRFSVVLKVELPNSKNARGLSAN